LIGFLVNEEIDPLFSVTYPQAQNEGMKKAAPDVPSMPRVVPALLNF
jgi:hypothetical protein